MLKLNTSEEKQLTFEVQIEGVSDFEQLKSFFRIVIDNVEYGFPCKVFSDSIVVNLPPLNKVVGKKIKDGLEVEVKLEVVVDGHYLSPWNDTAKIGKPLTIEAKIKDPSITKKPKLETKLVTNTKKSGPTIIQEKKKNSNMEEFKRNLTKDDIFSYMERAGTKNPTIQNIVYEQAMASSKSQEPVDILKSVVKIIKKNKE